MTPIRLGEGRKIVVRGEIVDELGPDGRTLRTLSYGQYRDYAENVLSELCHDAVELRARWVRQEQRDEIRGRLEDAGVDLSELADRIQCHACAAIRSPTIRGP